MKKQYYDHKSVRCDECAHCIPAGVRNVTEDEWKEGCRRFGYALTGNYPELADDCNGFQTPAQYVEELERIEREKKNKNKKQRQNEDKNNT